MTDLASIDQAVRPVLDDRFTAREAALAECRLVIRSSANAIRSLHRGEVDNADSLIDQASRLLAGIGARLADHPDILHAGFVADAAKECAEAHLTRAVLTGAELPTPTRLGIDPVPYLHGLGETVGECRRSLLDALRQARLVEAERLLVVMDDIVDLLAGLDYPDGMTAGLRRTTDVARSLVERSRSDLATTVVQERLRSDLERRLDHR